MGAGSSTVACVNPMEHCAQNLTENLNNFYADPKTRFLLKDENLPYQAKSDYLKSQVCPDYKSSSKVDICCNFFDPRNGQVLEAGKAPLIKGSYDRDGQYTQAEVCICDKILPVGESRDNCIKAFCEGFSLPSEYEYCKIKAGSAESTPLNPYVQRVDSKALMKDCPRKICEGFSETHPIYQQYPNLFIGRSSMFLILLIIVIFLFYLVARDKKY